jgi:hypothetical protein
MSYQLFTDKANKFNCNIEIEGTSLAKSQVRLVIESDDMSYMFKGRIENTGICEVIIPKTKSFLSEGTIGNMRLEVIADDVYFEPWSSDFLVKTNKKVNVMVSEQVEERPKLKVEVYQQPEEPKPIVKETTVKPKPKIQESNSELPNEMIVKTKNGQGFKITKEQFLNNLHKNIG